MDNTLVMENSRAMSKARLINYVLFLFIIFSVFFGLLYYFAISPDKIFYSIVPVSASKTKAPTFDFAIYGEGENKIVTPMDLAVDGKRVFVSDADANKVWIYDSNGKYKHSFGKAGSGNGEFNFPYGIALDNRGRVFVADMKNHRVQLFDIQGQFLSLFPNKDAKTLFNYPGGVAVVNNLVYITDIYKNKVFVFDLDGKKVLEFGTYGSDAGQFKYPNGVTADSKGNIYVSDSGNNRVQVFGKDGRFQREITGATIQGVEEHYASPRGVAVLNDEFLFVVSNMSSQVWASDLKGRLYYRFGERGEENNQFSFPYGIEINQNKLFVADYQNHGIKVFKY